MKGVLFRVVLTAATLAVLAFSSGCATSGKSLTMKVDATKPGSAGSDLESAYNLISSLKSPETVLIIYDASGSMLWPTSAGGEPRFKTAHRSLSKYVEGIPEKHNVGLLVYGSNAPSGIFEGRISNMRAAARSCTEDMVLTVPVARMDRNAFKSELQRLSLSKSYRGDTPIGGSIAKAVEILKKAAGQRKRIVVITDGAEECFVKDNPGATVPNSVWPEAAVKTARENDILVDIVAFGVGHGKDGRQVAKSDEALKSLKSLATGVFVMANTGDELLRALMQVEVNSFKFDLLDGDNKYLRSFTLGQGFTVDTTAYFSPVNMLKKKMKFAIAAKGERGFKKDIGVDKELKDVNILLKLKSANDPDPDIDPASLRWVD